jgi:hypothetical protein
MIKRRDNLFLIVGIGLVAAFLISIFVYWIMATKESDSIIADDIERLAKIFNQIDQQSKIIGFDHQRNYIDFLNVAKFVGSEVGSMNLKYPEKWQGPYLRDNPTYHKKFYEIVKTKHGDYIAPGYGIKLSNGKTIGKDIIYDENTNFSDLVKDGGLLNFKGRPLAMKLGEVAQKIPELPVNPETLDVD